MAMLNNQMVPRENDGKMMEIGGSTQEMMEIWGFPYGKWWTKMMEMMEIGDQLRLQCACALQWGPTWDPFPAC